MGKLNIRYGDLREYLYRNPHVKQFELAASLGISPPQLTRLLYPKKYHPPVADNAALVARLAELLNQSPAYVRKLYNRAA
ncbi:MAG TPA: hypothetical protein VNL91_03880 [Thermoanaerobaculia bacterium]|nr:hypothetical protein [Thermoanaerobaculia bacterium]